MKATNFAAAVCTCIVAFALTFLLVRCGTPGNEVHLTVNNDTARADTLFLLGNDGFSVDTLLESVVAANQEALLRFSPGKQRFVVLRFANNHSTMLVEPGTSATITIADSYTVEQDPSVQKTHVSFQGHHQVTNNYLLQIQPVIASTKGADTLALPDFFARWESAKADLDRLSAAVEEISSVSQEDVVVARRINSSELARLGMMRLYTYHNDSLVSLLLHYLETGEARECSIPENLNIFDEQPPVDSTLMDMEYPAYLDYLEHYRSHLSARDFDVTKWDEYRFRWVQVVDSILSAGNYPANIREFMKARNLFFWMQSHGPTPEVMSVFQSFKTNYSSVYTPFLEQSFAKYATIPLGSLAPEIAGTRPNGKPGMLSDYKGKVVLIDLWATWCGPCVAEIPFSMALQKELLGKPVVFLNVSVDKQKDWVKYLSEHPSWGGEHLLLSREEHKKFFKDYGVTGFPAYLIIDQQGKIVSINPPRPSSGRLKSVLLSLL